jgi:hypothetical protein
MIGVIAFHEKAGRSQGDSFWYLLVTLFLPSRVATVATLPSALFDERLGSLGASWVFSFQPVLPTVYRPRFHLQDGSWARRLTQSPDRYSPPEETIVVRSCCGRPRSSASSKGSIKAQTPSSCSRSRQEFARGGSRNKVLTRPSILYGVRREGRRPIFPPGSGSA